MTQRLAIKRIYCALAVLAVVWSLVPRAWAQEQPVEQLPYYFSAAEINTGDQFSLQQLTEELPLVLLTWAEDCPHCQRHMPYFAVLVGKLDPLETNVVQLVMGDDETATLDYLATHELDWPVLWGQEGEHDPEFEELGWPTTYVFAKGGELVGIAEKNGPAYIKEVQDLISDALIYWE